MIILKYYKNSLMAQGKNT